MPVRVAYRLGGIMSEPVQASLVGKTIDYMLGRNTLIGVASFMLLIISGYATWHGMRDFIIGVSSHAHEPAPSCPAACRSPTTCWSSPSSSR